MADIARSLVVKYGLALSPTQQEIARWAELAEAYIRQGYDREIAGSLAAKSVFSGFNKAVYASEADSIEALLAAAKLK